MPIVFVGMPLDFCFFCLIDFCEFHKEGVEIIRIDCEGLTNDQVHRDLIFN